MHTHRRRLLLRTPAVLLLIATFLTLFAAASGNTKPGLAIGAPGSAFFDPADLEEAFGIPFEVMPVLSARDAYTLAWHAADTGKIDHLLYCLDGSEASTTLEPSLPKPLSDIEKIGQADLYAARYGSSFQTEDTVHNLDRQADTISELTKLQQLCKRKKVTLTLLFLPLHTSRYAAIDPGDLAAYKTALARLGGLWDFSRTDISGDARYFYSKTCARADLLGVVLDKMAGKAVPFQNFGTQLTASNAKKQLTALEALSLPTADSYTCEVPILLYHHLTPQPKTRADISPSTFRLHMEALRTAGYTAVTAADMIAYVEEGKPLPPRPVWITFDDGYTSNYAIAYPILRELGLKATVFAIGSSLGKTTYKSTAYPITPHFSQAQAEEMMASGVIEVQSHTWDLHQHAPYEPGLARTTAKPLHGESALDYLAALRSDLETYEAATGWDFYALAYPKGQYTPESEQLFRAMGIRLTVSTATDRRNILVRGLPQSLYALCRHDIPEGLSPDALLTLIG